MVEPTARAEVVNVAFPPLSCAVPNTVVPAVKVTGPVAVTVGEVIVAVNVTAWPWVDGFADEVSVAALVVSFYHLVQDGGCTARVVRVTSVHWGLAHLLLFAWALITLAAPAFAVFEGWAFVADGPA